jgi:hypothetical protein
MNTSEHELNSGAEAVKDSDEIEVEPGFYGAAEGIKTQKGSASFNYSARKKIEEYLENKILIKLTYDTFDDIG